MYALSVIGKVLRQKFGELRVLTKRHRGDFSCEEFEQFRTFYMTCSCGWRTPLKILNEGYRGYYLQQVWEEHIDRAQRKSIGWIKYDIKY